MSRSHMTAVALSALLAAGAAQAQALKFSTTGKPNDPDTVAMRAWEAHIEENSDLEADVSDSASLVEQGQQAQALGRGTVDAAYMAPAWIAERVPAWSVLETPYLLTGPDHACAFRESPFWEAMVAELEDDMGIVLLDQGYQGTRTLNLRERKDITTPDDLAGMSIRVVPSPTNILMGEGLGGNPTPVPFSELYLALQTGTVDAQENPLTLIHSNKFYEVTDQVVNTRHKVLIQFPAFSQRSWEALSEEDRAVVAEGAREAMAAYSTDVLAQEARLQSEMEAAGLVFTDPDRDAFRSAMLDEFQASELAAEWREGMFEQVAEMEIPANYANLSN